MRRVLFFVSCFSFLFLVGLFFYRSSPSAGNLIESEELAVPSMSPGVVTPNIPTFVTFTADFSGAPDLKRPKLQFFDPGKDKWKTIRAMSDKGKGEDPVQKDSVYNLRLRFLDLNGNTEIVLPPKQVGQTPRVRGNVPTPAQLRLVAKKKGQKGIVVSPVFSVPTASPTPITIGSDTGAATLSIPQTIESRATSNPSDVLLTKTGPNGYRMRVRVQPNPHSWSLEQWILACYFGACNTLPAPEDAQTLTAFNREITSTPITVGGLEGLHLEIPDEGGVVISVFLDDPTRMRVLSFESFAEDPTQSSNFAANSNELESIIESLDPVGVQ